MKPAPVPVIVAVTRRCGPRAGQVVLGDVDVGALAEATEGYSGADLQVTPGSVSTAGDVRISEHCR